MRGHGKLKRKTGPEAVACLGKIRFPSADEARKQILRLEKSGNIRGRVRPYRCTWCGTYHFGHY